MRRILTVLLSFLLMMGKVPGSSQTADVLGSGQCGEAVTWTLNKEGTLTISGSGRMYDYESHSSEDGYVEGLDPSWEAYTSRITSVIIEDGVTYIGDFAFEGLFNLETISISASVTDFNIYEDLNVCAIENCSSLEEIIVDENNPEFSSDEYGILFNKDKTELYRVPVNCKIDSYAIPEGVRTIYHFAFWCCDNVTEIIIPSSVAKIGFCALSDCDNLTNLTVDENNDCYSSDDNGLIYSRDGRILEHVPCGLNDITIPATVKEIDFYAFGDIRNKVIRFEGDLPEYYGGLYYNTIYYPENNPTWTEEEFMAIGDNTYIPYTPGARS